MKNETVSDLKSETVSDLVPFGLARFMEIWEPRREQIDRYNEAMRKSRITTRAYCQGIMDALSDVGNELLEEVNKGAVHPSYLAAWYVEASAFHRDWKRLELKVKRMIKTQKKELQVYGQKRR